jgi:hypothetical protein
MVGKGRLMETLELIGVMAGMPLAIANKFGGAFAGIWLLVERDWGLFLEGIILAVFGSFTLSFALLPSLAVLGLGVGLLDRAGTAKWLGIAMISVSGILQYLAFSAYVFIIY